MNQARPKERGFTVLEGTIVLLIVGITISIAAPKISNAMGDYRMNQTTRQLVDLIQQAKAQAVAENRKASLIVDVSNRKMGLVVYDNAGNQVRVDYMQLPQGINFAMPANVSAPATGVPIASAVSFPSYNGSTTVFKQDFTSRGFPQVAAAGTNNAIYLSNGRKFNAITVNSVGGIRTYNWVSNRWESTKK